MDATQQIEDSFYGEEEDADEEHEAGGKRKEREPVAALKVFKNSHLAEMEVPLYLGENVLGRDPASCPVPLPARSVSSQHAVISISVYGKDRRGPGDVTEALLWDLGSLNGTRKGRIKLTPHVRYALTEGDSVVLADLPCQYVGLKDAVHAVHAGPAAKTSSSSEEGLENSRKRNVLPPVPVWSDDKRGPESPQATPKKPERTLVPESDSDEDEDEETHGRRVSKKRLASDSTSSDLSSPAFSTLLTPASKIIPESEDESSITPSVAPRGGKCAEVSSESPKPDPLNFNLDSDTDAEDEDVLKAKNGPGVEAKQGEDALTLDSDTDVEENEPLRTEAIPATPVSGEFHMDSDTDAEDEVPHSRRPAVRETELQLDSDTDAEENDQTKNDDHEPSNQGKPVEALESDSDTDLEVDTQVSKNSEARHESPAEVSEFRVDSDTDVEEDEKMEEGAPQRGEAAAGIPHSSTPRGAGMSEDEMETQAYLSPSQPFKRPVLPTFLCPPVSSGDISHEDEDFAVAETQSFVSEAAPSDAALDETPQLLVAPDSRNSDGDASFKLGLSESVRHPPEAEKDQELAQEDWHLQSTQLYAANSEGNTKAGQTQLDLEATQAYEPGTDQDEEQETLPVEVLAPPGIFTAETQLMAKSEEDNGARDGNGVAVVPEREAREEKEDEALVDSHLSTADTLLIVRSPRREEASQPYAFLATLKEQDVPAGLEQGRGEGLQKADEEQTQPVELDNTYVSIAETQPIGQDEEGPQNEAWSSRSPERGNLIAAVEAAQLDDSHVVTAEGEEGQEEERQHEPEFSRTGRMRQAASVDPTQPLEADMSEDEEEQEVEPQKKEEEDEEPLSTGKTEPARPLEIAETQPMCEDDEEEGQVEPSSTKTCLKGRRLGKADDDFQSEEAKPRRQTGRVKQAAEVEQTQPIESNSGAAVTETLPLCEDEDGQDEVPDREEAQPSRRTGRGSTVEPTQPLESDDTYVEEKEIHEEVSRTEEAHPSRRTGRGRPAPTVEPIQPLESDDTHAEDKEIREEERQDEPSSSKRSRRGRAAGKAQDKEGQGEEPRNENSQSSRKTSRGRKAGEDEHEEEPQSEESQPSRRTGRGRPAPTVEQTQPLESDDTHDKDKEVQEEERQDEPSPSKRSRRGRRPGKAEDERAQEVEAQIGKGKPTGEAEPTQPSESDDTHAEIAETLPLCEDEDGQEKTKPSRRTGRRRPTATVEPMQPLESDKEIQEEEGQKEPSSSKRSIKGRPAGKEEPQNENSQSSRKTGRGRKAGEDEHEEEPQSEEAQPSRRTGRGRPAPAVEQTQPLESDDTHDKDKEVQEEERQDEPNPSKRSRRGRRPGKAEDERAQEVEAQIGKGKPTGEAEPTQPSESDDTHAEIAETLPLCEHEDGQEKTKPSRRTGRRRPTATVEPMQPLESDKEIQEEEGQKEPSSSKRSIKGRPAGKEEPQNENSQSSRKTGRGRKAGKDENDEAQKEEPQSEESRPGRRTDRGRRASKVEPAQPLETDEQKTPSSRRTGRAKPTIPRDKVDQPTGEGEEEPVEEPKSEPSSSKRSRRGKSIATLEPAQPEESGETQVTAAEDEEGQKETSSRSSRGRRASKVEPTRSIDLGSNTPQVEKDEDRNGKSPRGRGRVSVVAETQGKKEEENGDGTGRGQKNTRQKFKEKKDGVETEREEATREKEDLLEEAGGLLEKETVKEDLQKEEQGKQRLEQIEKKIKEENKMMESKEAQGRLKEEDSQKRPTGSTENTPQDKEEAKPKRGRRTIRKSLAPPAGADDDDVPAKRTRSRSNSSNSVCSERSTSIVESQAGGRRNAERARPSRKSAAAAPSEKEDTAQNARSRSNSRSSDRSGTSVADPNQNSRPKGRKSAKVEEREVEIGQKPGRGRGRGGKREVKAEATDEAVSEDSQTSSRGRKRGADTATPSEETPQPTPKTPRRSLARQMPKVLFTGVTDEDAEKAVVRLGGALAKGTSDMTHLVTDKVRRTVKFLCAVAKGIPIVTPDWLNKCGKAGSFLSTNGFLVKDVEQERKFNFKLQDALRAANHQPLLLSYEIHVTPSVKPEPVQMKEIITCCGARYLPKMPSAHKAQTVVVSCQEDRAQCEKARSLSLPLVSAEFLLTGILQQKVDLQSHLLPLSPAATKPAARSRGK